jgi:PAS domain S-box-containing protein
MKLQPNITTKLSLVFVFFAALLLAGVGALAYASGRAALEAATISDLLSTAVEKEAALNTWVEDRQSDLTALADSSDLNQDVAVLITVAPTSTQAQAAHNRLVRELQPWAGPERPYLTLLVIEAETGQVIAATDPDEEGKFKEDRPFFINGQHGPYVQNMYYLLSLQKLAMTVATPLRSPDGQLLGVLAGELNLAEMNAIISRRAGQHQTDDSFLVNTSNLFVTQPRFISDPAVLQRGIHTEATKRCLAPGNGFISAEDYRGVSTIIVYRWLSERQLCLIVKIDQAEALAPSHAFGRRLLLIGSLSLLIASLVALWLARTITQPVLALQAGAVRFGQGELEARLPETSGDELGQLAREFNTMAAALSDTQARLRRHTQELEQIVLTRTATLQESEERTRLIVQNALDAVVTIDTDSMITGWNAQAEVIFGWSRQEVLERSVDMILPPRYREAHHRGMKHFLATSEGPMLNRRFEISAQHRAGYEFPVELTISPVKLGDSFIFSAFIRDITERKRAEEQFRVVVEASPQAIILVTMAGKINLVNAQAEVLFGYIREELLGQPVELLLPPEVQVEHRAYRNSFLKAPAARPMGAGRDLFALRKDGSQVPIEIGLNPITTTEGSFVLASIIDITERRRAEAALRQSEERFAKAFRTSPAALSITRLTDGCFVDVNESFQHIFEYSREELIGQRSTELNMLTNPDERAELVRLLHEQGSVHNYETTVRAKSGQVRDVLFSIEMFDLDNEAHNLALIFDISDRKQAEARLRQTAAELARSNAELEQFAYIASHDLQEPLRAVAGTVQLLQQRYAGRLDARADELIQHAVEGAARMQTLISDLLVFSRVATRGQPFQLIDCPTILSDALANLAVSIQESGAVITHDPLPTVMADATQLTQLLQNLISNAIKFRGDEAPVIHLGVEHKQDEWLLTIGDNGIGMEAQYFERIFAIFQRLHTRREYPGTGIGLAMCKKIVERHGGRIWVESELDHGSTFYFTLPDRLDRPE